MGASRNQLIASRFSEGAWTTPAQINTAANAEPTNIGMSRQQAVWVAWTERDSGRMRGYARRMLANGTWENTFELIGDPNSTASVIETYIGVDRHGRALALWTEDAPDMPTTRLLAARHFQ